MSGFLTWFIRNPMLLVAAVAVAAAATAVIPWGLGLSAATVAFVFADAAHHLAGKSRARRERREQERLAEAEGPPRLTSFRDWLNEKDQQRTDVAA